MILIIFKTIMLGLLFVLSIIDIRKQAIPIILPIFGTVLCSLFHLFLGQTVWKPFLQGMAYLLFFLLISKLTNGQIGSGDAFVFGMTGVELGAWQNLWMIYLSFLLAFLGGVLFLLIQKKGKKEPMPFIPYIFLAYFLLLFTVMPLH